ncbi:hypothetical protein ASPZODRAFT_131272 [Penicilliopsis zonata CBS 506.65]|uniref:ceramidase n=1 Tax=Penicilliopsis zonata CBS 506.65 TaxID=1073090 RepID=A0A1L9SKW2_9EURO|nr:hypothetical protein ASPZODRAFT_131272 [Penicilliopsis zonata CBS 506.65]OJJ47714.1 hypothetical protein ASPZODRAFT_131272 [Penicilliopsis zonata CBS 506.65]
MALAMSLGDEPPVYRIDLALPPAERYVHVAREYRSQLLSLTGLFDELVQDILPDGYDGVVRWIKRAARLFLRRLYSREETEEIRGISRETGIEMYLLVALNVLLDLMMGCTSGVARARSKRNSSTETRLLHFRTLDWGMDALRKVLVRFEFVRGPDYTTVLATNITYVGFVGVLTGVRKGLSLSLNFRPNHDASSRFRNCRYYVSHLIVLLGLRQSISSILRQYIIPLHPPSHKSFSHLLPLSKIWPALSRTPSTAAYLILCDGDAGVVLEKDHRTANVAYASSFIVATNNDHITPAASSPLEEEDGPDHGAASGMGAVVSMTDLIEDSKMRKKCMQANWDRKVKQARQKQLAASTARRDPLRRTRGSRKQAGDLSPTATPSTTPFASDLHTDIEVTATLEEIVNWTTTYPTTNEMTHLAVVMDASEGKVSWIRRYPEPLYLDSTAYI